MMAAKTKIQQAAEQLGKTSDEVAMALARIALHQERNKNIGAEAEDFAAAGLDVAVLDPLYIDLWQDILFHAVPSRKSFYKGWYLRRSPEAWYMVFARRFGKECAAWQMIIEAAHQAALDEREARKVWRKLERFAGVELEHVDTRTVAYWAAVNDVLCCRVAARHLYDKSLREILRAVYSDAFQALRAELVYRTKSDPQERPSKKKYLAAKADWAKARDLLEAGTNHFFSSEYVMYCMFQDTEPDLTADFEHLPRSTQEKTPVMWQNNVQVMQTFLQFVNDATEGSFEAEDVALILKTIKPLLARAKGQRVES